MKKRKHVPDLLPAYVNGTLPDDEMQNVRKHLEGCSGCRRELSEWRAVRKAAVANSEALPATPARDAMKNVRERTAHESKTTASFLPGVPTFLWQLLIGQLPLVRREIWTASALTISLGLGVALLTVSPAQSGLPLAIIVPIVAAMGIAFVYGPENDASLEVALSTPTSPRLVLLARLVLVYGYDLALVLAASGVVAFARVEVGLWPLIELWFGPMFFLSSLALLLSLSFGSTPAIVTAMVLWSTKLLATLDGPGTVLTPGWAERIELFWRASPVLVSLAVAFLAAAFIFTRRSERLA